MEKDSFASELLHEVKMQSKRWFIAFIIMTVLEAFTIAWFTLPTEEESTTKQITVDGEEGDANYFDNNQIGGDLNNGKDSGYKDNHDKEKKNESQTVNRQQSKKKIKKE